MNKNKKIADAPSYFRVAGLRTPPQSIDRESRVINGFAAITRGEALGHDMWIDGAMLAQVAELGNATKGGLKSRFTHPGLSADALGTYLGRAKNFRVEGDVVRADLHLAESAAKSPKGDLADYVMSLAEEDPEAFGTSIVFSHDFEAEEKFTDENLSAKKFVSPDGDNKNNYPHARIKELRAVDAVDSPAANPGGFFSDGDELPAMAEAAFSYLFGIKSEVDGSLFGGISPARAKAFFDGYLGRNNIVVTVNGDHKSCKEERKMEPEKKVDADALMAEVKAGEAARLAALQSAFADRPEFVLAQFGKGHGVKEAKAELTEELMSENKTLKEEVAKLGEQLAAKTVGVEIPGTEPEAFAGSEPMPKNLEDAATEYAAKHGCSYFQAFGIVAHKYPKLAEKIILG
jgi:hypothetical protein